MSLPRPDGTRTRVCPPRHTIGECAVCVRRYTSRYCNARLDYGISQLALRLPKRQPARRARAASRGPRRSPASRRMAVKRREQRRWESGLCHHSHARALGPGITPSSGSGAAFDKSRVAMPGCLRIGEQSKMLARRRKRAPPAGANASLDSRARSISHTHTAVQCSEARARRGRTGTYATGYSATPITHPHCTQHKGHSSSQLSVATGPY